MAVNDLLKDSYKLAKLAWHQRYFIGSLPARCHTKKVKRGAASPLLIKFLQKEYPNVPLLECNSEFYPVTIFTPSEPIRLMDIEPNSRPLVNKGILTRENWAPSILDSDTAFYWLQQSITEKVDKNTIVMKSLQTEPTISISCGTSTYFSGIETSQALEWEIYKAAGWAADKKLGIESMKKRLKLRENILNGITDPVRNGEGRAATVGISVLLSYMHENKVKILLWERGPLSSYYDRGKLHVLPSGYFQISSQLKNEEFSAVHSALKEFAHELFGYDVSKDSALTPYGIYNQQYIKELMQLAKDDKILLYFTGIAVNMLSLRPEIMLWLHIDSKEWFDNHAQEKDGFKPFDIDFKELKQEQKTKKGKNPLKNEAYFIDFDNTPDKIFRLCNIKPSNVVPVGAACIYAGAKTREKVFGKVKKIIKND